MTKLERVLLASSGQKAEMLINTLGLVAWL
jgi:hypothetical protein